MPRVLLCCVLALLWVAFPAQGAGAPVATIREGEVFLLRGASRAPIVEGVRLHAHDIVRTGPGGFVRIETEGGDALDIGPATLVRVGPQESDATRGTFLLTGWVKYTAGRAVAPADALLVTSRLAVSVLQGSIVVRSDGEATAVFLERGSARVEGRRGAMGPSQTLSEGGFAEAGEGGALRVSARPASAFMHEVPASFRDPLPLRFAKIAAREAPSLAPVAMRLEDVEPWLRAEPSVRDPLLRSWRSSATDPAVRAALARGTGNSPESSNTRKGER